MYIDNIAHNGVTLNSAGKSMQIEVYEKEIKRLNNIIDELEKYIIEQIKINNGAMQCPLSSGSETKEMAIENKIYDEIFDKLKSLKEGK